MFATDKTDYKNAATLMIHELGHWVDAYADGVSTPPPAGSYDCGAYLETLVDDAIYEKAWTDRSAK
ncbi:MAG: hypothetical protein FJX78_07925 [Armatimonadetes bacterium]|nr:hypothetical protein [Armatimonadota bacterium]